MPNRRSFIRNTVLGTGAMLAGSKLGFAASAESTRLTVLHTNDVHSRLEPFPMDGGRFAGRGGVAARASLIRTIREQEEHVLLLDAGDLFQGTPYFNFFHGEPEIKAMTEMGYDACTIGNHDFDGGVENLAMQLKQHASFPMLVANYNFDGTAMEYQHQPYKVFKKGNIRIGVFGVGIELAGLVPENLYASTVYQDPVVRANETAALLKQQKHCDFVICLSHLGYRYEQEKVSDVILAKESDNIDLIIGGHTHTFLDEPVIILNKKGRDVVVNQVGWAGVILGRLDFEFSKFQRHKLEKFSRISVSRKTTE